MSGKDLVDVDLVNYSILDYAFFAVIFVYCTLRIESATSGRATLLHTIPLNRTSER